MIRASRCRRLLVLSLVGLLGTFACGDDAGDAVPTEGDASAPIGDASTADAASTDAAPGVEASEDAPAAAQCGDGIVQPGEACDDGNTKPGDGCTSACALESGWTCPIVGKPCLTTCGDGIVAGKEECDRGSDAGAGAGCTSCRVDDGYKCPPNQPCTPTLCGDGLVEGTEACDDGNHDLGDGCGADCRIEPRCTGGACEARCGDGIVDATEACDDGNRRANDGCAPTCALEPGFVCATPTMLPSVRLSAVYRDFRGYGLPASGGYAAGHIDFENGSANETGIVAVTLGADGKPVYNKEGLPSVTTHGKSAFDQWFRDTANVNITSSQRLVLDRRVNGDYVFSAPRFFPVDNAGFTALGIEPTRADLDGTPRNFSFTTETRFWFTYKGTEVIQLTGDDDIFLFVNRRLVTDLGGVHGPQSSVLVLTNAASLANLQVGKIYEGAIFQAERKSSGSSYAVYLPPSVILPQVCTAQ